MSDQLLTVLSRRGQVAWPTCRRYIEELARRAGDERSRPRYFEAVTVTTLQALGYVTTDFTDGSGAVRIAPRVLARLPVGGPPKAVLVGHRTVDTERILNDACASVRGASAIATDDEDEWPFIPRRLCVEANSVEDLAAITKAVEARFDPDPAAWRVLQVASTLEAYRGSLQWRMQKDLNWARRDFDTQAVRWLESHPGGDGLAEFTDPQTQRRDYRLRRGDRIADVDRSWGCYAALAKANRHVVFFTGDAVLVPLHARLPAPFEAGLALCSGYAPRLVKLTPLPNGPTVFFRYRDVPRPLAELAATKLGQQLLSITVLPEAAS